MKQIIQYQKTGEITVADVPVPQVKEGYVLVRNAFSLISTGTERTSVETAQSSMLGKAKSRPDLVKQVMDNVKREGVMATYDKVKSRLDSFKELGYSCAGIVEESGCDEFKPGDRVACAGAGANHSEFVLVPKNLCAHVPDEVGLDEAAFTTVGAIAMQGVRQADLRVGEYAVVIGLGLIGLIAVQILKASGCKVAGIDVSEDNFELARSLGCDVCCKSGEESLKVVESFSEGLGCDAVIITAGTKSNEPVEYAMKYARKRGKVVVVGAVGMNIPRSPFYEKEIDFRISCSYGPGRYDADYEERGIDYPAGYVRWTEKRNMKSILDLVKSEKLRVKSLEQILTTDFPPRRTFSADFTNFKEQERFPTKDTKGHEKEQELLSGKEQERKRAITNYKAGGLDVRSLITHRIPIEEGLKAYDVITGKTGEKFLAVLIKYKIKEQEHSPTKDTKGHEKEQDVTTDYTDYTENLSGKEQERFGDNEQLSASPDVIGTQRTRNEQLMNGKDLIDNSELGIDNSDKGRGGLIGNWSLRIVNSPVVGFIGAGNFAQSYLLPNLKGVKLKTVVTDSGVNALGVQKKFRFESCGTAVRKIFDDPEINTVFIATRHDSHAQYVAEALKSGKHVFVEKPLSIDNYQLSIISEQLKEQEQFPTKYTKGHEKEQENLSTEGTEYTEHLSGKEQEQQESDEQITTINEQLSKESPLLGGVDAESRRGGLIDNSELVIGNYLFVGYNRRFSKPFVDIKKFFGNTQEPFVINYRVHAGFIPKEHWIQAPEQGGRIIGEACHFIDTMQFLTGAEPVTVFAESISSGNKQVNNYDNVAVIINFSDGSVGSLLYLANGDSSVSKERCEIFSGGKTAMMNNFESVEIHSNNKMSFRKFDGRKGHKEEVKHFCDVITGKTAPQLTFRSIWLTTTATFKIVESLRTGKPQNLAH